MRMEMISERLREARKAAGYAEATKPPEFIDLTKIHIAAMKMGRGVSNIMPLLSILEPLELM